MSKAKQAEAATPALNQTPGGSFTKDPESGALTQVQGTNRKSTAAKSATKTQVAKS